MKKRAPLFFFLFLYFFYCWRTYQDYGLAWDEYDVYSIGSALFHYLFGKGWDPRDFTEKISDWNVTNKNFWIPYSYVYGMILFILNRGFSIAGFHLLNLFFASALYIAAFEVLFRIYRHSWKALAGPLFLFFTPRLMGHIPINPRDATFAIAYFLSLCAIYFAGDPRKGSKPLHWLILGLFFGFTQSVRLVGLSLLVVLCLYGYYLYYLDRKSFKKIDLLSFSLNWLTSLTCVFIIANFFMILVWPYMGSNYLHHFPEMLRVAKAFPQFSDVLFRGRFISMTQLPWYFVPWGIWISTPLAILFFFLLFWHFVRRWTQNTFLVLLVMALVVNLLLDFILRPVIYPDWRHFLFLAPLISMIAAFSFVEFWSHFRNGKIRILAVALLALNAAAVSWHYVKIHPYEYVYFNELVGGSRGAWKRYPSEFLVTSLKEGMDWLKQNEAKAPDKTYKIYSMGAPFQSIAYFNKNMRWAPYDQAEYALFSSSYNKFLDDKNNLVFLNPSQIIQVIGRERVPFLYIYKLK